MRICENCVYNLHQDADGTYCSFACGNEFCIQEKNLFDLNDSIPMMDCGHMGIANSDGKPYCPICDCEHVKKDKPDLHKRNAECVYCGKKVPSSQFLPMFESKPNQENDSFYCGCRGWN